MKMLRHSNPDVKIKLSIFFLRVYTSDKDILAFKRRVEFFAFHSTVLAGGHTTCALLVCYLTGTVNLHHSK